MDITQLSGVSSDYLNTFAKKEALVPGDDDSFSAVLSTAMKSVDETNDLQNTAESEEVRMTYGIAASVLPMMAPAQFDNLLSQQKHCSIRLQCGIN